MLTIKTGRLKHYFLQHTDYVGFFTSKSVENYIYFMVEDALFLSIPDFTLSQ